LLKDCLAGIVIVVIVRISLIIQREKKRLSKFYRRIFERLSPKLTKWTAKSIQEVLSMIELTQKAVIAKNLDVRRNTVNAFRIKSNVQICANVLDAKTVMELQHLIQEKDLAYPSLRLENKNNQTYLP